MASQFWSIGIVALSIIGTIEADVLNATVLHLQFNVPKIRLSNLEKYRLDPFALWNPACHKIRLADAKMPHAFHKRWLGCKSNFPLGGSTEFYLYYQQLINDTTDACERNAFDSMIKQFKTAISRQFNVDVGEIQMTVLPEPSTIQSLTIVGYLMNGGKWVHLPYHWTIPLTNKVKKFLLFVFDELAGNNNNNLIQVIMHERRLLYAFAYIDILLDISRSKTPVDVMSLVSTFTKVDKSSQRTVKLSGFEPWSSASHVPITAAELFPECNLHANGQVVSGENKADEFKRKALLTNKTVPDDDDEDTDEDVDEDDDDEYYNEAEEEHEEEHQTNEQIEISENPTLLDSTVFELELPMRDSQLRDVKELDSQPYELWDPACLQVALLSKAMPDTFVDRWLGCKQTPTKRGWTKLRIYFHQIPKPHDIKCLQDALNNLTRQWQSVLGVKLNIPPSRIKISRDPNIFVIQSIGLNAYLLEGQRWIRYPQNWNDMRTSLVNRFLRHLVSIMKRKYDIIHLKIHRTRFVQLYANINFFIDVSPQEFVKRFDTSHVNQDVDYISREYKHPVKLSTFHPIDPIIPFEATSLFPQCDYIVRAILDNKTKRD